MEKETIKKRCPRKMSFRQEEWLNDMLQKGNGFFLFKRDSNGSEIDVSLHTKAIKMKEDVLRGKVQAIMALLYLIIILINGNIKAFFFCSLLFVAAIATNVGAMWDYYKECRSVIKAAKMIE